MKITLLKNTIMGVVLLYSEFLSAQVSVNSTGTVKIGAPTNTSAKLNIKGGWQGLHVEIDPDANYMTSSAITNAIQGIAPHKGYERTTGVLGYANGTSNQGTTYGVRGEAMGALSGRNYGVFGHITSVENGAAVYGTTHTSCIGENLTGNYAGYFEGDIKVTGSINGIILSNASSACRQTNLNTREAGYLTSQLWGLNANTYFLEPPHKISCCDSTNLEVTNSKEIDKDHFNLAERQVLIKKHYGLDADQLEEVFPDLVYENEDGTKSINYVEMVPILVQAINELQSQIDTMKGEKDADVKKATGLSEKAENVQVMSLGQNKPNPFSTTTEVEVTIPESVQSAFVYVYDLQGKKVQQVDITARGRQTVKLAAADLAEGMYLYSLIADGKVVETRRMIIEK